LIIGEEEPRAKMSDENEQAVIYAMEQALRDMPFVEVLTGNLYEKIETFGNRPELSVEASALVCGGSGYQR
jgi:hypothetical protein